MAFLRFPPIRPSALLLTLLAAVMCMPTRGGAVAGRDSRRPAFSVKASPQVSFTPARVVATAELRGGVNDFEEYYCPTVEWDWGDDTQSESTADCEPYQAGKSEIRRRFSAEHIYRVSGNYRIQVRLKKNRKPVVAAAANIQVRAGVRDDIPREHR